MKRRTINYFKKLNAMKVLRHPLETDLMTLLSANFCISRSNVVKYDILNTLQQLNSQAKRTSHAA